MREFSFSDEDLKALAHERYDHRHPHVQRKMEVLWLKSHGLPHQQIADLAGVSLRTVQRYLDDYLEGGLAPRRPERGRDGALPRGRLRAVIEYVEGHLDANPSLEQLAAVARLSPYHFARQFKRATGLPPHRYVIARRVERAQQLLQAGTELSLAEVAAHVGFSDQSQFSRHFKRLVGVTPGQFRTPARIA